MGCTGVAAPFVDLYNELSPGNGVDVVRRFVRGYFKCKQPDPEGNSNCEFCIAWAIDVAGNGPGATRPPGFSPLIPETKQNFVVSCPTGTWQNGEVFWENKPGIQPAHPRAAWPTGEANCVYRLRVAVLYTKCTPGLLLNATPGMTLSGHLLRRFSVDAVTPPITLPSDTYVPPNPP